MTEQRFDIIVQDKVARTIKDELTAIGGAARGTRGFIAELRAEMAGLASAAGGAGGSATTITRTFREEAAASNAARAAIDAQRQAVERLAAATKQQADAARAAAAAARAGGGPGPGTGGAGGAGAANSAATAAQLARLGAAASIGSGGVDRLAMSARQAADAWARARPATPPTADTGSANAALGDLATAARLAADELRQINRGPAGGAAGGGTRFNYSGGGGGRPFDGVASSAGLASHEVSNLLFQLNDVFVSLASGQKPLTVFIQQGSQIGQIAMQAGLGWKGFGMAALTSLGVFKRVGDAALDTAAATAAAQAAGLASAQAGALGAARAMQVEIALAEAQLAQAGTATEAAAATARLTAARQAQAVATAEASVAEQALAAAQAESAAASARANGASVTRLSSLARGGLVAAAALAATAVAVGLLAREANNGDSGLRKYTEAMGYTAKEVKKLNAVQVSWGDTTKALFKEVGHDIQKYFADQFGISMSDVKSYMKNAMDFITEYARRGLAGIYALGEGTRRYLNEISKDGVRSLGNLADPTLLTRTYGAAYNDADKYLKDLGARTVKTARGYARARQDAMAQEMRSKPAGGGKGSGWDRAQELRNSNAELDAQIALTAKYGDELDRANQLEQISKKFRDHNVPLTAAETAALEAKIRALQEGRRVQEAMTAAEEQANGPMRKYEATQEALNRLLASGAITLADHTAQMRVATRAYDDALNPLAALNRELERNGRMMGLYGKDKDVASYIQQLEQAAEAQGKSIYKEVPTAANDNANGDIVVTGQRRRVLNDDAQGMVDEYKRQQQQGEYGQAFEAIDPKGKEDPGSNSYILDHHRELYDELKRLREEDVISEAEAAQRKQNLDRAYLDARLEGTSSMLGQLSQLQTSKNKEMAALGKAAAIAQATIDGYRAVQAALVGPPGPPWSFAIAGVTAAMTAVNVAKIAGVGFQQGGHTGYGADNDVAGPVHRNEYVFDANATRRIGVPALEALRKGQSLSQPGFMGGSRPKVSVYPGAGVYSEVRERTDGEIEIIAERVAKRVAPRAVADDMRGSPNSKTSKAVQGAYGLRRSR